MRSGKSGVHLGTGLYQRGNNRNIVREMAGPVGDNMQQSTRLPSAVILIVYSGNS
ncbi:hypothetical protein D3C81_2081920 [compost metagenome]